MMKQLTLYLFFLLPLFSQGQTPHKSERVSKLVIDEKKTFYFAEGDSSMSLTIDTLIMHDRSRIIFSGKKKVNLIVNHAVIGKNCLIEGTDTRNNGTHLTFTVNFVQLRSLNVDVSGQDSRVGNRQFANGNGGDVVINYLSKGIKPQISDKKRVNYISVSNQGAGTTINPRTDIAIIRDQIRTGSGRPLGQLPNGRVYSGNMGKDGTTGINAIVSMPN